MSNTNPTETNYLSFYDFYAKKAFWTKEEAVALSFDIDPRRIEIISGRLHHNQEGYFKSEFCRKYNELIELVKEGLLHNIISSNVYPEDIVRNISLGYWPNVNTLSFISWCKDKDIPFPQELEKLAREYNKSQDDEIDLEAKCKELQSKNEELQKENDRLKIIIDELKNDKPNIKSLNYYRQLAMGALALKYGNEQAEIWRKWAANNLDSGAENSKYGGLNFTNIEKDLEALNTEGVIIKHDAIRAKIKESANLLKPKIVKTS